uniref:Uncharacterized protein n=1 Tax=Ananas comosus var. bracteatus TaxID=296719 RepID=A0A6V7Q0N2_ANACO|nr:unnamed protein product [Ananas comosus var. bracteatus]
MGGLGAVRLGMGVDAAGDGTATSVTPRRRSHNCASGCRSGRARPGAAPRVKVPRSGSSAEHDSGQGASKQVLGGARLGSGRRTVSAASRSRGSDEGDLGRLGSRLERVWAASERLGSAWSTSERHRSASGGWLRSDSDGNRAHLGARLGIGFYYASFYRLASCLRLGKRRPSAWERGDRRWGEGRRWRRKGVREAGSEEVDPSNPTRDLGRSMRRLKFQTVLADSGVMADSGTRMGGTDPICLGSGPGNKPMWEFGAADSRFRESN